jgi:chemotaxis protein CheZ
MTNNTQDKRLALARELVLALESKDEAKVDQLSDELTGFKESRLFQEVGRLTRQLHDTMGSFSDDTTLTEIAKNDIPDAKERLQYVITMTEQAANQTLNVVEELMPVSHDLNDRANKLSENWQRFLVKKMPFDEFKSMSYEITEHFNHSVESLDKIQTGLNDVLLAQGFQDITGQIIRKVIDLVQNLEDNMVDLVRVSGAKIETKKTKTELDLPGPVVPNVDDKNGDVATSQDDVDDLLSSLGF